MPWMLAPDGTRHDILPEHTDVARSNGYTLEGDESVVVDTTTGLPMTVATSERDDAIGVRDENPDEFRVREDSARKEREHGGVAGAIGTGAESFVDTATFGAYGAATDFVLGDEYTTNRRERAEVHEEVDFGGKIAGVIVPTLLTGGTGTVAALARATPVALAERAAIRIAAGGAKKGFARQLAYKAAGHGVEGAALAAGEAVQELALSEDPLTLERVGSTFTSKMLYGGLFGAGAGAGGHAMQLGLRRAKNALGNASERLGGHGALSDDVARMTKPELEAARRESKYALGQDAVEQVRAIREADDVFLVTSSSDRAVVTKARGKLRNLLDNPKLTAEKPWLLEDAIYREEVVLQKLLDDKPGTLARLASKDDVLVEKLSKQIDEYSKAVKLVGEEAALYGNLHGLKIKGKGKGSGVTLDKGDLEDFRVLLQSGAAKKMRSGAMERLPATLDRNLSLQSHLKSISNNTAPRLAEIKDALDGMKGGGKKAGMLEQAAQGVVFGAVTAAAAPFAGTAAPLVGAKVAQQVNDWIFGRMGKVASEASARTASAVDAFLDIAKKAERIMPPLATKTLLSVQFAPDESTREKGGKQAPVTLTDAYKAREREVLSQTEPTPNGSRKMAMAARQALADRMSALYEVDPLAADQMEALAARRIGFLATKLPKRPPVMAASLGPDNWRPSDMAMRTWARYVAAVEDPGAIEERLADGSVTPEDAEAMRTVYPERFAAMQMMLLERMHELRASLPYERRLALSIFSGVPVDPAMDPRILRVLQGSFLNEEGSEGGTQAPRAQAQFGSVSKPKPTAAQERAG